ncbi:hypothetical protein HC891_07510 [Candidatus Gracilibacteria bacterium]|nr:hypothetical protein [Candidatus Gracilibacteria bacterium]
MSLALPPDSTLAASYTLAASQQDADDLWDDRFGPPGVPCCAGFNKVFAIEVVGTNAYVGGEFSEVGGLSGTPGIGLWNGRRWISLDGGVRSDSGTDAGVVYKIASDGTDVYVIGNFDRAAMRLVSTRHGRAG